MYNSSRYDVSLYDASTLIKLLTESSSLSDTLVRRATKALSESVVGGDTYTLAVHKVCSDAFSLLDTQSKFLQKLLSNGITLTDAHQNVLRKALAEALTSSDAVQIKATFRILLNESPLFLTDASGAITVKGVNEQLILTDWLTIREPNTNTDFTL